MTSQQVFLATNNSKKSSELRRIIREQLLDIEVITMTDVKPYPEPDEIEWTFAGNALIKARAGVQHTGMITLADDSGLCVDALGGMPGVRSSRWAGMDHEDVANMELVLRQIDDVPPGLRSAQFRAVVALVTPDGREYTFEGVMTGRVAATARGSRGFGYDPIFVADDQICEPGERLRTNSELSPAEKDAISHRGRAIRAMLPTLIEIMGLTPGKKAAAE